MRRMSVVSGPALMLLLALPSCAPKQPRLVSLDSFSLVDAHHDSLHFEVAVTLKNQDSRRAVLESARYEIWVDGVSRGSGTWEGRADFFPNGNTSLVLPFRVGSNDVDFWVDALLHRNSLQVEIPLQFRADTGQSSWSFYMNLNTDVPLEGVFQSWLLETVIRLNPRLERISSPDISIGGAVLPLSLSLENRYPFDIELQSLQFRLNVSGIPLGDLNSSGSITLPAEHRETLDLEARLSSLGPVASATMTLIRGELSYTLLGNAVISMGGISVTVPLSTSGMMSVPGIL